MSEETQAELVNLEMPFASILERVAAKSPGPGGGAVAAMATCMAAALCAMAARYAVGKMDSALEIAERADELRRKAEPLVEADAAAFGQVMAALKLPKEPDPLARQQAIRRALSDAADVPMAVAEMAAEVASLGALLAQDGNPNLVGDAAIACMLAEAATRSAACLVSLNLAGNREDHRLKRVSELVSKAAFAARRASRLAEESLHQ